MYAVYHLISLVIFLVKKQFYSHLLCTFSTCKIYLQYNTIWTQDSFQTLNIGFQNVDKHNEDIGWKKWDEVKMFVRFSSLDRVHTFVFRFCVLLVRNKTQIIFMGSKNGAKNTMKIWIWKISIFLKFLNIYGDEYDGWRYGFHPHPCLASRFLQLCYEDEHNEDLEWTLISC